MIGHAGIAETFAELFSDLAAGDTISAYTVVGEQTAPGKSSNIITSITIKDQYGNKANDNYTIEIVDGLITVLPN